MKDKYFLDTNVLVYSFDGKAKAKQKTSQELISSALSENQGVISYQVVQEFIHLSSRKFEKPFSLLESLKYLEEVLEPLCEIHSSMELYRRALRIKEEFGYAFYDALIISGAKEGGCKLLYSEDLRHEQTVVGVKIINPFLG